MRFPEAESNTVELKQNFPEKNQIIKTIIGFCNQQGGKIVIGVADNRDIVGLAEKEIEDALESIDLSVFDACTPHIIPRIYAQRFGEKTILIIEVMEGMNKPYYRRVEGLEKGTYIRLGRHTLRASAEIIQELQWQSRGIEFERLPVYQATIDDLDDNAIKSFLDNRKNHKNTKPSEQVLRSYQVIAYEQSKLYPTTAGVLLFAHDAQHFFSEAMIICTHFKGTSGREVIATIDCMGTLFNQFHQAYAFMTERLYRSFTIKKLKRHEKLEIPEIAIREALLNAIVHRNYHMKAPTKIAIYDDRIEIFSPGQFPGPIPIDNLVAGISYLRNPVICKILREAQYIEKLGSGFITIFSSYEKFGLKTPQIIQGENFIKCILPRVTKMKSESRNESDRILTLFSITSEINVNDVVCELAVSRATAIRRLNELIKQGRIIRRGSTKAARYTLTK